MTGPAQQDEDQVPWASHSTYPAPVEGHQVSQYLSLPEEHRVIKKSPKFDLREGPLYARVQASSAPAELEGSCRGVPHSAQSSSGGPPRSSVSLKPFSLELNADAPYRAMRDTSDRSIDKETHPAVPSPPGEDELSERARDAALHTVAEEPAKDSDETKDASDVWGRPFRIEWIRTTHLPFFRTRHLRNPWNHGREVKVSRDGTELEPDIGRQLLEEWDKSTLSPADVLAVSSSTMQRRPGPKSMQHAP
jgi:hypothetical protein